MLNKAMVIGNLGKDPEKHTSKGGLEISKFSVATTKKNIEKGDKTTWHNIVCFGKLAEICNKYLRKGSKVYIEGELNHEKYLDSEGATRHSFSIIGNQVQMLGERKREVVEAKQERGEDKSFYDNDIPF